MVYVGCVSVPLTIGATLGLDQATVAMLVNADLLVAGVITLIQSLGAGRFAGARMPVVGGAAFSQVATMISIGNTYGLPAIWGCMLAGGVIGLDLARGMVAKASLLIAAVAGVLLDFSGVGDEPLFAMVTPFHFGSPEFPDVGVISMTVVMMFLFSETIASVGALSEITGKKLSRGDVARTLSGDALSGVLGGIWSNFPDWAQTLLSDGVVLAALAAFFLNLLFNHTSLAEKARSARNETKPANEPLFL